MCPYLLNDSATKIAWNCGINGLFKVHHKCRIFRLLHPQNGPVSDKRSPWLTGHKKPFSSNKCLEGLNLCFVFHCLFCKCMNMCYFLNIDSVMYVVLISHFWKKVLNDLLLETIQWLTSPPMNLTVIICVQFTSLQTSCQQSARCVIHLFEHIRSWCPHVLIGRNRQQKQFWNTH